MDIADGREGTKCREMQGHRVLRAEHLRLVLVLGDRGRVKGGLPQAVMDRLGFDWYVGVHPCLAFKAREPSAGWREPGMPSFRQ